MSRRFTDLDPSHPPHGARAILKWGVWDRLLRRRQRRPPGVCAPRVQPDLELVHQRGGPPRLTWIGHASFLGTLDGVSFLIDPIFSMRAGWIYRRYGQPGLGLNDLPPLDALLVTHNHYDHLDEPSLQGVAKSVPVAVPTGMGRWFRRRGFLQVVELSWWESTDLGNLRVTLIPARHWSRRRILDTNHNLWGGFVVKAGGTAIYHAGDTAWFDVFSEIGGRFPGLLAAMLPIGAYSPAWFMEYNHLNPEQAGRAFLELGARHMVPMHWGAFQLTDEPLIEPAERLREWWSQQQPGNDRHLRLLAVGQTVVLEEL